MQREGEISISQAAERIGLHPDTVRRYAQDALQGDPRSRLQGTRLDGRGHYWIPETALHSFLEHDYSDMF